MFFYKKVSNMFSMDPADSPALSKIQKKMMEIDATSIELNEAVHEAQNANVKLAIKLKKHLADNGISFADLSEHLNVGVIVVDFRGQVKNINIKAKSILNVKKDTGVVGNQLFDLILSVEPINPPGDIVIMDTSFFYELSQCILKGLMCKNNKSKTEMCSECISCLPCLLKVEEQFIKVKTPTGEHKLRFTISVLENGPDELDEISYVLVFRKSKK